MEFDHPYQLLQIDDGYFTKMVEQTGPTEAEHLLAIAKEAYFSFDRPVEKINEVSKDGTDESFCMKDDYIVSGNGNATVVHEDVTEYDSDEKEANITSNQPLTSPSTHLTKSDDIDITVNHSSDHDSSPLLENLPNKSHVNAKKEKLTNHDKVCEEMTHLLQNHESQSCQNNK